MKAVLIIHGFVGSLYDNEYLMNYLEFDSKLKVFAKTLPGHYMNDTYQKEDYTKWINFIDKWIEEVIYYGYKKIYIIGYSMGGILASYAASKYREVKKIVFINVPFKYLNLKENKVDIIENKDYKNYLEVLTKVLHTTIPFFLEFTKLVKEYHDCIKKINCSTLILQSSDDQIISLDNGEYAYNNINSIDKYLTIIEKEKHEIFFGDSSNLARKKEIAEYIRIYLRGGLTWKKIWKKKI